MFNETFRINVTYIDKPRLYGPGLGCTILQSSTSDNDIHNTENNK